MCRSRSMTKENNMNVISRWNFVFNCPEFLAANGHDFTLHLDKAMSFETFEGAARVQGLHFPTCSVPSL